MQEWWQGLACKDRVAALAWMQQVMLNTPNMHMHSEESDQKVASFSGMCVCITSWLGCFSPTRKPLPSPLAETCIAGHLHIHTHAHTRSERRRETKSLEINSAIYAVTLHCSPRRNPEDATEVENSPNEKEKK